MLENFFEQNFDDVKYSFYRRKTKEWNYHKFFDNPRVFQSKSLDESPTTVNRENSERKIETITLLYIYCRENLQSRPEQIYDHPK